MRARHVGLQADSATQKPGGRCCKPPKPGGSTGAGAPRPPIDRIAVSANAWLPYCCCGTCTPYCGGEACMPYCGCCGGDACMPYCGCGWCAWPAAWRRCSSASPGATPPCCCCWACWACCCPARLAGAAVPPLQLHDGLQQIVGLVAEHQVVLPGRHVAQRALALGDAGPLQRRDDAGAAGGGGRRAVERAHVRAAGPAPSTHRRACEHSLAEDVAASLGELVRVVECLVAAGAGTSEAQLPLPAAGCRPWAEAPAAPTGAPAAVFSHHSGHFRVSAKPWRASSGRGRSLGEAMSCLRLLKGC